MLEIRCFGDKVLFTPTQNVDFTREKNLQTQIDNMMTTLSEQGGVGIAANQCANIPSPVPSIIIVGIASESGLIRAQKRYPNKDIPKASVLINPIIIERSAEIYFPSTGEGCLSIPCSFRGKVSRHRWVMVQYQDIRGTTFEEKFSDLRAHIVQHEHDHLKGILFMHHLLEDMPLQQRQLFATLIDEILAHPLPTDQRPQDPTLVVDRDEHGHTLIDINLLKATLSDLDQTVLLALKRVALNRS